MKIDSSESLARWMEDEGLVPFTLLKITPKPSPSARKTPKQLKMEWGVQDLEHEGERDKFLAWPVVAEGITRLRLEDALDPFEECQLTLGEASGGLSLRLEAGGALELSCERLVIDPPITRTRKRRPRPYHGELTLTLEQTGVTLGQVRAWLGVPDDAPAMKRAERMEDEAPMKPSMHVSIEDGLGHPLLWLSVHTAKSLTVARGKWATDALWSEVWSKARRMPGVTSILSRDLRCAPSDFPAEPPPKPPTQVWPDVFGAVCAFEALNNEALAARLGLPTGVRAELAGDAPTMGQAARRVDPLSPTAVLRREGGPVLVRCHADPRERSLDFHRERGCDDATWLAVWRGSAGLPDLVERRSRTTQSPPDPWPDDPAR